MRSKVSELLNKINRLAESGQLSALEIDLMKEYLRTLYEEVDLLSNGSAIQPVKAQVTQIVEPEPEVREVVVKEEEKKEAISPKRQEEHFVTTKAEVKAKVNVRSSINEIIQSSETLNSKLKSNSPKEIHHKLSSKPLKELIDLNKRFIVVNELFRGNTDAFVQAVQSIDTAGDYSSAESFICSELSSKYGWDKTSEVVKQFYSLVRQRFGQE